MRYTPECCKANKIAIRCTKVEQANKFWKIWTSRNDYWNINPRTEMFEIAYIEGYPSWQSIDSNIPCEYFVREHNLSKTIDFSEVDFGDNKITYNYLIL